MQSASIQMCGDPWLKNGCATNFETPISCYLFIFYWFFQCNFALFFLQAETPPAAQQNTFYGSLRKARRRCHFSVFGSSPKRLDSIYLRTIKRTLYTFKQKQHVFLNSIFLNIYVFLSVYLYIILFIYLFVSIELMFICSLISAEKNINSRAGLEFKEFRFCPRLFFLKNDFQCFFETS